LRIIAACLVLLVFALCLPSRTSFDGLAFVNREVRAKVPRAAVRPQPNSSPTLGVDRYGRWRRSAAELAKLQQQVCLPVITSAMREGLRQIPRAAGIGAVRIYAKIIGSLWSDRSRDLEL
jgi:hypothetical protein